MTPGLFTTLALDPACQLLPARMQSPDARLLLLAIAWQESGLTQRRQLAGGPARGYFQCELIACAHVLTHRASRPHVERICEALDIPPAASALYAAVEFHDVLAVVVARLNLWTHPAPLPPVGDIGGAYRYYEDVWNPGRPRPERWPDAYAVASAALQVETT